METTVNEYTRQTTRQRRSINTPPDCPWAPWDGTINAGSNIKFGQRSRQIVNPKDKFGFRRMSPFRARFHERIEASGSTLVTTSTSRCKKYAEVEGYPGGMTYWHRGILERLDTPTDQNRDLLIMRAEQNLAQQDINLLQFAAFLPSTLKNIKGNVQKMDSLIDILHDKRRLMQRFKGTDWRSLYLQWLFVWTQLHRDVIGGLTFLKKQSRPIGSLVTGRSKASSSSTFSDVQYPYANTRIGKSVCESVVRVDQRAVSVARISCELSYTHNALGIDNPVYLAWDLLRWSWVIDQFVDFGLFISSLTSLHGLEYFGTSYTRRAENSSIVTVEEHSRSGYTYTPSFSPGTSYLKSVDRIVKDSPTRNVTLRNPFQNSVAVTAAVIAALSLKMEKVNIDPILRRM